MDHTGTSGDLRRSPRLNLDKGEQPPSLNSTAADLIRGLGPLHQTDTQPHETTTEEHEASAQQQQRPLHHQQHPASGAGEFSMIEDAAQPASTAVERTPATARETHRELEQGTRAAKVEEKEHSSAQAAPPSHAQQAETAEMQQQQWAQQQSQLEGQSAPTPESDWEGIPTELRAAVTRMVLNAEIRGVQQGARLAADEIAAVTMPSLSESQRRNVARSAYSGTVPAVTAAVTAQESSQQASAPPSQRIQPEEQRQHRAAKPVDIAKLTRDIPEYTGHVPGAPRGKFAEFKHRVQRVIDQAEQGMSGTEPLSDRVKISILMAKLGMAPHTLLSDRKLTVAGEERSLTEAGTYQQVLAALEAEYGAIQTSDKNKFIFGKGMPQRLSQSFDVRKSLAWEQNSAYSAHSLA